MHDVAIVGAGELGGLLAHVLARNNAAREVRLVDDAGRIAEGKALDIAQAAPIERFATSVAGSTDLAAVGGAAVVVIADRAKGGEWQGEDGLSLMKRLNELASGATIVCAGASQRELVERGARELRLSRTRLLGSAPEALAAAVKAIVALETAGSPTDVALSVAGVPPHQIVVPWEDASIGGFAATRVLDEPARRRIAGRLAALWPPGPYTLAVAAAKVIDGLLGRSRGLVSCFVAPDDTAGRRTRAAALPVRIGPGGIVRVALPTLSGHDRVALDNAMML